MSTDMSSASSFGDWAFAGQLPQSSYTFITGSTNSDTWAGNDVPCAHVTASTVEYRDGLVFGVCRYCGERIQIERLPGGLSLLFARSLAVDATQEINDNLLLSLNDLQNQIEAEKQALEEAEHYLMLIKRLVREAHE